MGCIYMSQQPNLFTLKPRLKFNQTQAEPTTKIYPHTKTHFTTLSLSRLICLSPKTLPKWLRPLCSAAHTYSPPPPQAVILSLSLLGPPAPESDTDTWPNFACRVLKVSSLHFCRHSSNKSVDPDGVCFCPASKLFRFLFLRGC